MQFPGKGKSDQTPPDAPRNRLGHLHPPHSRSRRGCAAGLQDATGYRFALFLSFPATIAMMGWLVPFLRTGQRVARAEAALLMAAYVVYLAILVGCTLAAR